MDFIRWGVLTTLDLCGGLTDVETFWKKIINIFWFAMHYLSQLLVD